MKYIIFVFMIGVFYEPAISWKQIEDGLYLGDYKSPQESLYGNSIITILKVDPYKYDFNLYHDSNYNTAKAWSERQNLLAVVNAGMYNENGKNLGFMKQYQGLYNGNLNKDNAILAFNSKSVEVPRIQIIDRQVQDWNNLKDMYNSYAQSIRMTSFNGSNLWAKRAKMWSIVVVAIDKDGNVLFIHSRSHYTVHDFINIIKESPLIIKNMMYLEGGPEASLYLNHNGMERIEMRSYETGFYESNDNTELWPIPNVIGITKKKQ